MNQTRDEAFAAQLAAELARAFADAREITTPALAQGGWARLQRGFVAWCARTYLRVAGIAGRY